MDFVLANRASLAMNIGTLLPLRTDRTTDKHLLVTSAGVTFFACGRRGYGVSGDAVRFCDGQFKADRRYYHPLLRDCQYPDDVVDQILALEESVSSSGVFVAGRLVLESGAFNVATDWLGQYPIYYSTGPDGFVVSNNILMLERLVPKASRSILPAVENIALGGCFRGTHVSGVDRVPFGYSIKGVGSELSLERRSDHCRSQESYEDAIALARDSITDYLDSVLSTASEMRDANLVVDITGGSDSRCVLSFLLASARHPDLSGRCMTQYPSPDANVGGWLMHQHAIRPARYPFATVDPEKVVRQNAALSGGGRDSGSVGSPLAFATLVHFRGVFGEIGGATPGIDYVSAAGSEGTYSHERAADIFLSRRRNARALELLTEPAVALSKVVLAETLASLEEEGFARDHLIAEMYVRKRCRTHFGLSSFIEGKSRILPDILANRWLLQARRCLPARLHTANKVILDLILSNGVEGLAFAPMAGKKWDAGVVPSRFDDQYARMQVIDALSAPLGGQKGRLFKMEPFPDPSPVARITPTAPTTVMHHNAQGHHIGPYQSFLKFFLVNLDSGHEVWRYFRRDKVEAYVGRTPNDFHVNGIDINAMGVVAAAIFWRLGLEVPPAVVEISATSHANQSSEVPLP